MTTDLPQRIADAIGPTMRIGLQDAELDGQGGAERINEWIEWIADALLPLFAEAAGLADKGTDPDEGDELVCVDECGFCDACGMEPFGTPAEGWREAARFLRRTPRDSRDYPAVLTGARVIEEHLRTRAEAATTDEESR